MPILDILSTNQLQAVRGRRPRPILGDLISLAAEDLPAQYLARQRREELDLQREEMDLRAQALTREEAAQREAAASQRRTQRQQILGTAISGVGQGAALTELARPGTLSKLLPGGAGATSTGAALAPSTAEGAALLATEESAGLAASGAAGGESAGLGSISLGSVASGLGGAAVGASVGKFSQQSPRALELANTFPFGFFLPKGATSRLASARVGLGVGGLLGYLTGGPVGGIIGAVGGGLGVGLCIVLTACAENAEEIALAKRYRERFMSTEAKRGYYMLAEPVAARMRADTAYCQHIRHALVLPLLRVAAHALGEGDTYPSVEDQEVAHAFLDSCEFLGRSVRQYVRQTGEVV